MFCCCTERIIFTNPTLVFSRFRIFKVRKWQCLKCKKIFHIFFCILDVIFAFHTFAFRPADNPRLLRIQALYTFATHRTSDGLWEICTDLCLIMLMHEFPIDHTFQWLTTVGKDRKGLGLAPVTALLHVYFSPLQVPFVHRIVRLHKWVSCAVLSAILRLCISTKW